MRRIYGLDTWRAALLVVGPLIHSAPSGYLSDASSLFRMPAFFFVAGFLGGHGSVRRPLWLSDRIVQLLLPTFVVWIFVLTPAKIAIDQKSSLVLLNPNHLWFLIDLAIATFVVHSLVKKSFINKICSHISPFNMVLYYVLLSTVSSVAIYPLDHISDYKIIVSILQSPVFTIHYAAGFIIANNAKYAEFAKGAYFFYAGFVIFFVCFAILRLLHQELNTDHQYRIIKLLVSSMKGLCGAVISIGIFASALRINWRPNFIHLLSRASYSIYLLHVPIILLVGAIVPVKSGETLKYLILSFSGFVLPWVIHNRILLRSADLMYLFNGVKRASAGVIVRAETQSKPGGERCRDGDA